LQVFAQPPAQTEEQWQMRHQQLMREQHERSQRRLAELVESNSTLPITISAVQVLGATNTRRGFLERLFDPIVSKTDNQFYTLREAIAAISQRVDKLSRFDIYHQPISTYIDRPDPANPSSTPTDLDVFLSVREKSRVVASSGTWAGSNDGSVYFNVLLRNLFGGAESLNANASFGTRTRSAYSANFDTPVLSDPDLRWEIGGLQSSTNKSWASHEELLRGGFTKFKYMSPVSGHRHELCYNGVWRQITALAEKASPAVRADAGDSFKSSMTYTWINDQRNNPLLPTSGYLIKTAAEVAGAHLGSDVAFAKLEAETQQSTPVPIPFVKQDLGISLTTSLRGGVLCPLTLGGRPYADHSRINDRFFIGGPTDVRGFRHCGLGPHDGKDAIGGDVYAAGGASLLIPFPRVGKESPLRLQAFVNGGRLLALKNTKEYMKSDEVFRSVQSTIAELGNQLPSMAVGLGVIYALPVARFELNFSLPLVIRQSEDARKGLSLGVGISFL